MTEGRGSEVEAGALWQVMAKRPSVSDTSPLGFALTPPHRKR